MTQFEISIESLELSVLAEIIQEEPAFGGQLEIIVHEVYDASVGVDAQNLIALLLDENIMDRIENEIWRQINRGDLREANL